MIRRGLHIARRLIFYSTRPALFRDALSRRFGRNRVFKVTSATPRLADCAFKIPGGLGDHLIAARYIRDLRLAAGDFTFDIFSSRPGIADWIFQKLPGFRKCYEERFSWPLSAGHYDIRFSVTDFVSCDELVVSLGAATRTTRNLFLSIRNMERFRREIKNLGTIMDRHPLMSGLLAQTAFMLGHKRHNFVHAMSGIDYTNLPLPLQLDDVREKFGLPPGPYITIADGYDLAFHTDVANVRSTKSYPHYDALVRILKERFPALVIVQVGKDVGRPMIGVDKVLLNQTSLSEIASLISTSSLHIDNEGGLVHLASALGVKSCVIFGPTPVDYFGYDGNINIRPTFCGGCYWVNETWMVDCPRRFDGPQCLVEQTPEAIVSAVTPYLQGLVSPLQITPELAAK